MRIAFPLREDSRLKLARADGRAVHGMTGPTACEQMVRAERGGLPFLTPRDPCLQSYSPTFLVRSPRSTWCSMMTRGAGLTEATHDGRPQ